MHLNCPAWNLPQLLNLKNLPVSQESRVKFSIYLNAVGLCHQFRTQKKFQNIWGIDNLNQLRPLCLLLLDIYFKTIIQSYDQTFVLANLYTANKDPLDSNPIFLWIL